MKVRELGPGETHLAARTLLELRPALGSPEALVRQVDERQRPSGYRVVGAFEDGAEEAAAVAGFRINEYLAWGRHLYVDDLEDEARHCGCTQFPLDSGVGEDREDAHRFYFRHGLRIASYHFAREL